MGDGIEVAGDVESEHGRKKLAQTLLNQNIKHLFC